VSALCEIGEIDRARGLCEKLLGYASDLGLYAEEIDTTTGRHLGNFPQAFTHLALINAVMHVIRAETDLHAAQSAFSGAPAAAVEPESVPLEPQVAQEADGAPRTPSALDT
jgi:hypothetical protein